MKNQKLKTTIISFLVVFSTITQGYSQWVTKLVDNKLDPAYKIAYCSDALNKVVLKFEAVDGELAFYIAGGYFCDDMISVDIALIVSGESKRYTVSGSKSSNSKALFLIDDLLVEEQAAFFKDLKACTSAIIRTNESHCTSDIFKFNMAGSTRAINFMLE